MAKKILIIDDETDIVKMLVYRLEAKGYETFTAATGRQGIDIARRQKPDLILLDLRLPDFNGIDVARKIKDEKELKDKPIILVTASVDNLEEKVKNCGAVDYIAKPMDPEQLYAKIDKYI